MTRWFSIVFVCVGMGVGAFSAQAHHGSHGGGSTAFYNPFSDLSRPPRTFVDFLFSVDGLDQDVGEIFTFQLSGEYAVTRRFSVGGRVPFLLVRDRFMPSASTIGDVALSLKGVLWQRDNMKFFLTMGSEVSFPTGSEPTGTGNGSVMFSPYLTLGKDFGRVQVFLTVGSSVSAAQAIRPSFDYATGLLVPLIKGSLPIDFSLAFQGSTALSEALFETGSTKAYLKPGFIFHFRKGLLVTMGGRFSVVDSLKPLKGVFLSPTSTQLLSDVLGGFLLDVNYSF